MSNRAPNPSNRTEALVLVAFCGFLFFYGLGAFGLLGADEPRYAQVAREMLDRSDWVTPTLVGKPWLEKPVLYYWQAMLSFRVLGDVTDQAARLPSALDAAELIVVIYFFLRRFRPGSELDGALIAASSAGIIGFARAAATDMPLASAFSIALLAWYAWYETGRRIYLAAGYLFLALATLAKGPVAPALSAVIILFFLALKRDWSATLRTLWIPGVLLYLAATLPWYLAVQRSNPEFFRVFILEHNLARFSRDVYHHHQPFWFYLPVLLLATVPWTLLLILTICRRTLLMWSERSNAFSSPEDSWPTFLLTWSVVPVVFFSASQSKLPGYILPSVPAAALLVAEYLAELRSEGRKLPLWLAASHGLLCGVLVFAALSAPSFLRDHRLAWTAGTSIMLGIATALGLAISVALLTRNGLRLLRPMTLLAVVVSVAALIRFAAPALDDSQSARSIARSIQAFSHEPVPIALYHVNRAEEYGLEFYLNREAQKYEDGNIPAEAHVLVAAQGTQVQVARLIPGRRVSYLTNMPAHKLDLYWIGK